MIPEGMKPEKAAALYAETVAEVKASAAKEKPHSITGEQVTYEIRRRWAGECGVEFDEKPPEAPKGAPAKSAEAVEGPAASTIRMPPEDDMPPVVRKGKKSTAGKVDAKSKSPAAGL